MKKFILTMITVCLFLGGCGGGQTALHREEEIHNIRQQEELEVRLEETMQENLRLEQEIETLTEEKETLAEENEALRAEGRIVSRYGGLFVEGGKLMSETGESVVLRGFSTHGLTWYPRYINAGAMQTTKEYGATVFRMAMYTEQEGSYAYDPVQNLNLMLIGIENALSQDMYVIVDWHVLREENPLVYVEQAKSFFAEVSGRYGDEPGILYEICNEPNGSTSWEDIRQYAEQVIPVIRENAPHAVIIVGTPKYSSDLRSAFDNPLDYDNIMYAFHLYVDVSTGEDLVMTELDQAVEAGFPVFVSEWGISYGSMEDVDRIEEIEEKSWNYSRIQQFTEYTREHDISWCVWSLSNKKEVHSLLRPWVESISGWETEDFTPFGQYILGALSRGKER